VLLTRFEQVNICKWRSNCAGAPTWRAETLAGAESRSLPLRLRPAGAEWREPTAGSILRKSHHGLRLNEHMEYPEGDVVFRHACKMGLEGNVSEIALQVWAVAGLAQVQEARGAGCAA
jgi:hypothetical protein